MTFSPSVTSTPMKVMAMPDRYIWIFLTQRDVSELFSTFSKYTPEAQLSALTNNPQNKQNSHKDGDGLPAKPEQNTATAMAMKPRMRFCSIWKQQEVKMTQAVFGISC